MTADIGPSLRGNLPAFALKQYLPAVVLDLGFVQTRLILGSQYLQGIPMGVLCDTPIYPPVTDRRDLSLWSFETLIYVRAAKIKEKTMKKFRAAKLLVLISRPSDFMPVWRNIRTKSKLDESSAELLKYFLRNHGPQWLREKPMKVILL